MKTLLWIVTRFGVLPALAELVRRAGALDSPRDIILAHIRPDEAELLKSLGGSGRVLSTGLPSFDDDDSGGDDDSGDDDDDDDDNDDDDSADADGNYGDGVGYGGLSDGRSGGTDDNADADGNYGDGLGYGGLNDGKSTDAWGWSYSPADADHSANYGYGSLSSLAGNNFATAADMAPEGRADRTNQEESYNVNTPDEVNLGQEAAPENSIASAQAAMAAADARSSHADDPGFVGSAQDHSNIASVAASANGMGDMAQQATENALNSNAFDWGVDDANAAAYSATHGGAEAHETSALDTLTQMSKDYPWVANMLGLGLTFLNPTVGVVYNAARGALDGKTASWLGALGGAVGGKAGQLAGSFIGNTVDGNSKGALNTAINGGVNMAGLGLGQTFSGLTDNALVNAGLEALGSAAQSHAVNYVSDQITSAAPTFTNTGTASSLSSTADNSDNASSDSASSTISGGTPATMNTAGTTLRTASSTPSASSSGISVGGLKWFNGSDDSDDTTGLKKLIAQSKQQRAQALHAYISNAA
jgi:hypothetical protein